MKKAWARGLPWGAYLHPGAWSLPLQMREILVSDPQLSARAHKVVRGGEHAEVSAFTQRFLPFCSLRSRCLWDVQTLMLMVLAGGPPARGAQGCGVLTQSVKPI